MVIIQPLPLYTLFKREVWQFFKYWNDTVLEPIISTLLFMPVFLLGVGRQMQVMEGMPYLTFLAPGLIMMTVLQNVFYNPSISLMVARMEGRIHDFLMPPFTPLELTLGLAGGGMVRGFVVCLAVSLALAPFAPVTPLHFGYGLALMLVSTWLLSLVGILVGIAADTFDQLMAYAIYLITPLSYLSAAFFPNHALPPFWQQMNLCNPFFYMIDGYRYALTGQSEGDIATGLIYLAGLSLGLYLLIHRIFATGWRLKS